MKPIIKVTVCVVTYNQILFIRQCLQSLVDQKTNFAFNILVFDDCSSDGTQGIIMEFSEKYPEIVQPIFHKENKGALKNFLFAHSQGDGEYIAHMDGDDYALPGKLQIQADYLDSNKICNIVWTPVLLQMRDKSFREQNSVVKTEIHTRSFDRSALIRFGAVGVNSTKMYRKTMRGFDIPNFEVMDYFMNVEHVGEGVACFVGCEPLGVYRVGIGIASSNYKTREILANSYIYFAEKYPESRLDVNIAALIMLLSDLKNRRSTWYSSMKSFFLTFHPLSMIELIMHLKLIKSLNVK